MIITSKLKMDLQRPGVTPKITVSQNDRYSRNLEIALYSGGVPWNIPEDAAALIRYRKFDGRGGEYDTMPDGTVAWTAQKNVLTVALAPQVLTAPGFADLSVSLVSGEKQLSTFAVVLNVQPVASAQMAESENYFYVTGFLPGPSSAAVGQYFRISSVNENGRVTGVEAVDLPEFSGGGGFTTDETLTLRNGVLSVNTADQVEADNTLPVTSAAVNTVVGNVEALLKTI